MPKISDEKLETLKVKRKNRNKRLKLETKNRQTENKTFQQ